MIDVKSWHDGWKGVLAGMAGGGGGGDMWGGRIMERGGWIREEEDWAFGRLAVTKIPLTCNYYHADFTSTPPHDNHRIYSNGHHLKYERKAPKTA